MFITAIFVYIVSNFFDHDVLRWLLSLLTISILLFTFFRMKGFLKILGSSFLILGCFFLILNEVEWDNYILSFGRMLNLVTIVALLPILALPIKLGNYKQSIKTILTNKMRKSLHFYFLTSGLSYLLSSFINIATIPLMYYSMRPSADLFPIKEKDRFLSRAILQGYGMAALWAPVTPIVGIVIEMTGVSWYSLLPIFIPLSILGLSFAWLNGVIINAKRQKDIDFPTDMEWEKVRAEMMNSTIGDESIERSGKLVHIVIAILLFNVLVMMLEQTMNIGFLLLISLIVIPFSFIWSLLLGKTEHFFEGIKDHFTNQLLNMKDQFFVFLAAGFFISSLYVTGADQTFNVWILSIKELVGNHLFITLIPLIPFTLTFIGMHPLIVLALVAGVLDADVLKIAPEILALAMLGGAVASFIMGPFNAAIGLMSNNIKEHPFRISRWNLEFTIVYLLMIMSSVYVFQLLNL